jgi:stearoyl-CoA desaturase (delta-9 desaturase)
MPAVERRTSHLRLVIFLSAHLIAIGAIWTGVSTSGLLLCAGVFAFQLLAATIGYHRYFSHRSFKTSRAMQAVLAFCAQASLQKGTLWWAALHRYHHRHSDQEDDLHSPKHGLWWSYIGWIFDASVVPTRFDEVPDLSKFPELRLLNRFQYTPGVLLALACFAIGGAQGLVVGFVWGTILSHHAAFANNCFAHIVGTRPYATTDGSRNNWFLAAITFGEGWHNNHHRYPGSARNGFLWWEIDLSFYALLALEKLGLVWDLRMPPSELVESRGAAIEVGNDPAN